MANSDPLDHMGPLCDACGYRFVVARDMEDAIVLGRIYHGPCYDTLARMAASRGITFERMVVGVERYLEANPSIAEDDGGDMIPTSPGAAEPTPTT